MRWISERIVYTYVQLTACSRVITRWQWLRNYSKIKIFC